ncbi:MAG: hypothetical protein R6U17_06350 [Thermoplasmata archaeon]
MEFQIWPIIKGNKLNTLTVNIIPREEMTKIDGFGPVMFEKIMEGRPYFSMEEVREVEGVGGKRYRRLEELCWCF